MTYLLVAVFALTGAGCGASFSELREHHVWERALCEAAPEERELVRAGIEEDQQLTVAVQAVPRAAIAALAPEAPDAPGDDAGDGDGEDRGPLDPLADITVVRVRPVANEVPLASWEVTPRLLVDGRPVTDRQITFATLLRRTGETVPPTRRVTRSGGGSGLLDLFGRIVVGVMTVGLSELFRQPTRDRAWSTTEVVGPSPSEIARAAPHASAIAVAWAELADGGPVHAWPRPADDAARAIELEITYRGADVRRRPCELRERIVVPLEPGVPVEEAIERRFGHREHTLAELRRMR